MRHARVDTATLLALWPAGQSGDELEFHHQTGAIATALYEARLAGEWEDAHFLFDCLAAAQRRWPMEPQVSILDNAYAQAASYLASWMDCEHRFQEALPYIEAGWASLDAKSARRAELGLRPSPSSSVRGQLLCVLGDLKWRLDDSFAEYIIPAADHVQLFQELSAALRRAKDAVPINPSEYQLLARCSVWTGLWTAVTTMRFAPDSLRLGIREFNRWHTELLGYDAVVKKTKLGCAQQSIWHWHYEIAKFWLEANAGQFNRTNPCLQRFTELYDGLERAIASLPEIKMDRLYVESVKRDRAWMSQEMRKASLNLVSPGW